MKVQRVLSLPAAFLAAFFLSGGISAEDEASKVELKAKKGDALEFTVKRETSSTGTGQQGDFSQRNTSTIKYRIEVGDRKDNGDLVLKVTYGAVKVEQEGRGQTWEFDSSKKDGEDEAAAMLRDAISKTITVNVSGNRIGEISGFPEVQRPQEGQRGDFRRFRALRVAGEGALRGDLVHILASTVSGHSLEKGKAYRREREERAGGAPGGQQRGRGGFGARLGGDGPIAYTYEGAGKEGDVQAAKFSLAADETQRPSGDGQGGGRFGGGPANVKGSAVISLKDGLLLKLEARIERESKFERDGQSFSFSNKSKLEITRGAPKRETVSL